MEFTYDEVLDLQVANVKCVGRDIEVRLYCGDAADMPALATRAIRDVENQWDALQEAIVGELLSSYNAEPATQLSAQEFWSRLVFETIDYDAIDVMYTLFFGDDGLFGGHAIQVSWDPEEPFHATVTVAG